LREAAARASRREEARRAGALLLKMTGVLANGFYLKA
jgi:hypothetical protein